MTKIVAEWKLAIAYGTLFVFNAMAMCYISEFNDFDWDNATKPTIILKVVMMLATITNTLMAFISKASKKISSGSSPFDDTQIIDKPSN